MQDEVLAAAREHGTRDECLVREGFEHVWLVRLHDGRNLAAHIVVCTAFHDPKPGPEYEVAHRCGNGGGGCFAPLHLRWDTRIGNMTDSVESGTISRGEQRYNANLTRDQAMEIYLRRTAGETGVALAREFGISDQAIAKIFRKRTWAWIHDV
jgi:hypothetical protein